MAEKRNIPISIPVTGRDEWEALREPLETGWLTSGPKVRQFESRFAELHEVPNACAVTSATTALHLAMVALGIKPGDEVILPAFTWVSTANVIEYCGAKPVFVDIDLSTFNIDVAQIAAKVTPHTKAIMAVSLFGLVADIPAIEKVAPGIPLVEDAACAAGAAHPQGMAGSLGTFGCFSFHPRKSVTTGEGGMITTANNELAALVDKLRNHGASVSEEQRHKGPKPYILPEFDCVGFNYRMTDLQGAVGCVQLEKLAQFIEQRDAWAKRYWEGLHSIPWLQLPAVPNGYKHGWQSYVTIVDNEKAPISRNEIMERLQQKGISTRPGTHAVHMLEVYASKYNIAPEDFPNAQRANDFSMSLPMHNGLVEEDIDYIIEAIQDIA